MTLTASKIFAYILAIALVIALQLWDAEISNYAIQMYHSATAEQSTETVDDSLCCFPCTPSDIEVFTLLFAVFAPLSFLFAVLSYNYKSARLDNAQRPHKTPSMIWRPDWRIGN